MTVPSVGPDDASLLPERTVIAVSGADRLAFLDGLLSTATTDLTPGALTYGALLTPQGKIVSDMMVFTEADRVALDVPSPAAANLIARLNMYKLRAAVTVTQTDEAVGIVLAPDRAASAETSASASAIASASTPRPDPRAAALGSRFIAPAGTLALNPAVVGRYTAARVAAGVPDAPIDFALGDTFPHDANMDLTGGINFKKGCFVGQEVVSRMRHRGTARRRVVLVSGKAPLPAPGSALDNDGKPVGWMGSSAGDQGLALVRIDRVSGTVRCADQVLKIRLPEGAPFALAGA